jgi:hypothetical protein
MAKKYSKADKEYNMARRYYVGEGIYWTKKDFRRHFDGNKALFEFCWRKAMLTYHGDEDLQEMLEEIAKYAVNDERSQFYIYG